MFRALYDWTLRLAHHRHAVRSMAAASFAESSFFPIPPDVMLVPMILANRDRAYWIATGCTRAPVRGMAAVSFAESSFFPIPPDVMLVPMILANRDRAYWIATVCTVASVA